MCIKLAKVDFFLQDCLKEKILYSCKYIKIHLYRYKKNPEKLVFIQEKSIEKVLLRQI